MTLAQLATTENAPPIDPPPSLHDDDDSKIPTQVDATPSGRLLFEFKRFLKEGALNNVFGFPPDSANTPASDSVFGCRELEVTELSGGLINFTVRVAPRHREGGLEGNAGSVVAKYAPPFVAAIGEDAPFGTFRQVSTTYCVLIIPTIRRYPPTTFPSPVVSQSTNERGVFLRSSNTVLCLCSVPRLASPPLKPLTGYPSRGSLSSSRTRRFW